MIFKAIKTTGLSIALAATFLIAAGSASAFAQDGRGRDRDRDGRQDNRGDRDDLQDNQRDRDGWQDNGRDRDDWLDNRRDHDDWKDGRRERFEERRGYRDGLERAGKTPLSAAGSILLAIPASVLEAATTAKDSVAGTLKRIADLPMTTAVVMAVATKTIRIQVSFEKAR